MGALQPAQPSYGAAARALLRLWPRLIVAYGLVALLVYCAWPQIAALVAHGARSLILALNPLPHVGELNWTETGYLVSDGILGKSFYLQTPSLRLMFGFPLGLALALPGHRSADYWQRVGWTLVTSLVACSLLLAIMADWYIGANLLQLGIKVHAGWQSDLLRQLGHRFWDLAILYPFLACLVLGRAALRSVEAGFASGHSGARTPHPRWLRSGTLAAVACVLLLLAIEFRAQDSRDRAAEEVVAALVERNPELGTSFLRFAKTFEKSRDYPSAAEWYRQAAKHEVSRKRARRSLKRLRHKVRKAQAERRSR